MNENWIRVSRDNKCPICGHADWCMVSKDGNVCICQRVESNHPTKNSGGWVHRLKERESTYVCKSAAPRVTTSAASRAADAAAPDIARHFAELPRGDIQARLCRYLENELGLPHEILEVLDWRWDQKAYAVAIPMRDPWGAVTGIRYRRLKSGDKWAMRGSKDGLFFDPEFIPYDAEELVICEGPTDAAAAMACGAWCVGRSSCGTGRDLIRELMRARQIRRVSIVADDDPPKPRPGGGTWRPGLEGARRLAEGLKCAYRIVFPPPGFKDIRAWYRTGKMTSETFKQLLEGEDWNGPGIEKE